MIPRHMLSADEADDYDTRATKARHLRAARKAANVCICGPLTGAVGKFGIKHGLPVASGGRCARCLEHRRKARS
jgi:hypothetical protein